jgi:RNA polymerase sigma factor for flagellar operon FliA
MLRDDVHAAALAGLWDATKRYRGEPERFQRYAAIRIQGAIKDELRRQDWLPRRTPGHSLLAVLISAESVAETPSRSPTPEEQAIATERATIVGAVVAALPSRERDVIERRYYRDESARQTAAALGVSEPRVSQIHVAALARMKRRIEP